MKFYGFFPAIVMISLVGTSASAQQSPQRLDPRRDEAEALYQEGNRFHNRNMTAEALEKFEKAYAIYPAPNTLVNLAREEHLLGRKLQALRHYREAVRNPLVAPGAAELATKYIAELEPSFARVDVKGPSGMVVKLGNEEVTLPLPEPLDIEPGTIMATGEMNGKRYHGSVTVAAGQVATIKLHGPPGMMVSESQGGLREKDFWSPQHITGVALGGAAVVAAGLGIGFLAARNGHASDAKDHADACSLSALDRCRSYQSSKDSANRAQTGEIISFVAAGALAVGAAALLVPWQHWMTKEGSRVSARVIPTSQGVLIDGAF